MTAPVRQLIDSFDALPDAEKHEVAVEILKRVRQKRDDLSEAEWVGVADQLFCTLDDEETGHASR